jgi:hypothetical protein
MNKIMVIVLVINFFIITAVYMNSFKNNENNQEEQNIGNVIKQPIPEPSEQPKPPPQPPETKKYEPKWTDFPPLKSIDISSGKILGDIVAHAKSGEGFASSDPCTKVHETTHGICKRESGQQGVYCLENRMCYINYVNTTLSTVSRSVPASLHGKTYNLYLKQQQTYFESEPIYIFDEWVAYANGAACAIDLTESGKYSSQRWDTILFMREFDVYALTLAMVAKPTDEQFKNFLGWHLERTATLYEQARKHNNLTHQWQDEWMQKWKASPDAEELRAFTRSYLGEEWTKRTLGF